MLDKTLTVILAGGHGSRLQPLTLDRAKPAVPFGGQYRVIDFTLSNCIHSGLRRVLVLTQYKSHSLQKHLRDGWSLFNPELGDYITAVPPQMRLDERWYAGTADALFQNLYMLERSEAEQVLVLSGDHIYRMDYAAMLNFHKAQGADVTVACMEVPVDEASQFGVMGLDTEHRIVSFDEKPVSPATVPGDASRALVSMGIYVFSMELLATILPEIHAEEGSSHDFGKDVIPALIERAKIYGYNFGGSSGRVSQDRYWRDVGTLDSFYEANMELLDPVPPLDLYQQEWPIRTYQSQRPPSRTVPGAHGAEGIFINSIAAGGVVISGAGVQHSILFPNVRVDENSMIHDSILFDGVIVGKGAQLNRCVVDKGVHIPAGEQIGMDAEADARRFTVSAKGVVVVPKGYRFDTA